MSFATRPDSRPSPLRAAGIDGEGSAWGTSLSSSNGPLLALDLRAMHDPPRVRIERIAPVHGAAIVPENQIADAPDVLPGEFRAIDEGPELVAQRLGLLERKSDQIGVAATAEIEHAP